MSPESAAGRALPGRLLDGRYRVGAIIARGGMSTVYRGVDTRLQRPVAIKIMSESYVADPSFLIRFQREARLAASLRDPAVVAVFDQGRDTAGDHDLVYLVMELVDGGTLRDLLREVGALSVPVALSILEPVLGALGAAHTAGLVHRDVKPENVLISGKGEIKVADFGLARAVTSQTMATGNVILGTVAYLSPEQVATGKSDPRSDVYSAGVLAYEMLTGRPPYSGENPISVAYQHVHSDVPPVTDEAPGIPVELDDIILAATRRDPDARPRDATALLTGLIHMRRRLGIARVPVPVPRNASQPDAGAAATARRTSVSRDALPDSPTQVRGAPVAHPTTRTTATHAVGTVVDPAAARPRRRTAVMPPAEVGPVARAGPAFRAGPDHSDRSGRAVRFRRWLIVAIIILLLGAVAAAGGWWLGGRWAFTPSAIGVDQATATQLVRQAGLVPQVSTGPDNVVPAGDVADTDPEAGVKVLRGSTVTLKVSSGRPTVPDVEPGSSVQDAQQRITAAHLRPQLNDSDAVYDDAIPAGRVTGTDPAAGTALNIGTIVDLIVSRGAQPVVVPDVAGKAVDDARNALLAAGFVVGPEQLRFSADQPAGNILGSDPAAGSTLDHGSTVTLLVADSLTVPDVRGLVPADARARLSAAGFTVTESDPLFDPSYAGGLVAYVSPAAGTRIDPAAPTVTIAASSSVAAPALVGLSYADARSRLADLGLTVTARGLVVLDSATVVTQNPSANSNVAPGSQVAVGLFP